MRALLLVSIFCTGCFDYAGLSAKMGEQDGATAADLGHAGDAGDAAEPTPDLAHGGDMALPCKQTLADVGTGDFTIRFTITTTATVQSTVLYQRAQCDSTKDFWDLDLEASGNLIVEVGQGGAGYATAETTLDVNDGNSHDIVVTRKASALSISADGSSATPSGAAWNLGALPALGVASGNPCEPPTGSLAPLVGTVIDVCVSD